MARTLVWDLPVRVFHWMFAALVAGALAISLLLGDDSPGFPYHAMLGMTAVLLVVLRIAWGFAGTRHARFASFAFGPGAVVGYLRGVATGSDGTRIAHHHVGHNPASAYAIFAMLALALVLGASGVVLGLGNKGAKDAHEIFAYAMLATVVVHVLGVAIHTVRLRENITASMVHGRKDAPEDHAISSARVGVGLGLALVGGAWLAMLLANYDAPTRTLKIPLAGVSLHVGDAEDHADGDSENGTARENSPRKGHDDEGHAGD